MKRIIYTAIILIAIIIAVALSFALRNNEAQSIDDPLTKLTVSEVTHSVFYAPQYAAINLGFFEEEGLDIELINGAGADKVMTAVLANQVDIGFSGPEASIYVYNEGKEDFAVVFAQLTKRDGSFLVGREANSDFKWTDLEGKHILPGRKGGVPYMALEYVIKQNGLNPQTDMNFDNSISFDAMTSAFTGGVGDYVTCFEPVATTLENQGKGYVLASVGEEAGEIPYTAYFAKKSYIEQNEDIIQKFVNAISKGQKWVKEHTDEEIANAILKSFPDTSLDVLTKVVKRYKEIDAWNDTPYMTKDSFNRLQEVMVEAGELTKEAPYEEIVNNSFCE